MASLPGKGSARKREGLHVYRRGQKLLAMLLCASLGCAMCACTPRLHQEDELCVQVICHSGAGVHGLHDEYALGAEPMGGGIIQNADGAPVAYGESVTILLGEADFVRGADRSQCTLCLWVVDAQGKEMPVRGEIVLDARQVSTHTFVLTGNAEMGFCVLRAQSEQRPPAK